MGTGFSRDWYTLGLDRVENAANQNRTPLDFFAELARKRLDVVEGEIRPWARAVEKELYHHSPHALRDAVVAGDVRVKMVCVTRSSHVGRRPTWMMRHSVSVAPGFLLAAVAGHKIQDRALGMSDYPSAAGELVRCRER